MQKGINTLSRFLYLNSYAFLLLFCGVGMGVLPIYKISYWLIIPQVITILVLFKGSYSIFSTWDDKKRKYIVLMERNAREFRPDTFSEYMKAPCGRLLTKIVLEDLDKSDRYKTLKEQREPLIKELKENCTPKEVKVYTIENYKNNDVNKE